MTLKDRNKAVIKPLPAPSESLMDAFSIRDTVGSLQDYIKLVLKIFKRHQDVRLVKVGDPVYAGDCFKTLARAESEFIYTRGPQEQLQLRPGVVSALAKAGIQLTFRPHDLVEKTYRGERMLTFAPKSL